MPGPVQANGQLPNDTSQSGRIEPIMHGKTQNCLFFDFHVETLPNTRMAGARP
jgi:prepilin-type processing-associated H-X9-DG protein